MRRFHTRLERLKSFNKLKKRVGERHSCGGLIGGMDAVLEIMTSCGEAFDDCCVSSGISFMHNVQIAFNQGLVSKNAIEHQYLTAIQ
jgi:hypothetical protein